MHIILRLESYRSLHSSPDVRMFALFVLISVSSLLTASILVTASTFSARGVELSIPCNFSKSQIYRAITIGFSNNDTVSTGIGRERNLIAFSGQMPGPDEPKFHLLCSRTKVHTYVSFAYLLPRPARPKV